MVVSRTSYLLRSALLFAALPSAESFANGLIKKAQSHVRPLGAICRLRMSSSVSDSPIPVPTPSAGAGGEASSGKDFKPGTAEAELFNCSPSVAKWRAKQLASASADPLRHIQETAASTIAQAETSTARAYWAYHLSKFSFFTANGFMNGPIQDPVSFFSFRFDEAVETFHQDLANIEAGLYKVPWDMDMGLAHRQANPFYILDKSSRVVQEAAAILQRRWSGAPDKSVWIFSGSQQPRGSTSPYPEYYKNNFHFQTDGWMSSNSAKVYEASTETIFSGRQDAMQRNTLIPLGAWMKARGGAGDGSGVALLEVGSGTGRFNTFVRDNFPLMDVTVTDLSPFYLEEARENGEYWEAARRAGLPKGRARYAQAAAEELSQFEEACFDAVLSVYLFHEVPHEARAAAAREWARVLRPGGVVVLTDSVQLGDRPAMDAGLGGFQNFNEPHYEGYIREDLAKLFTDAGLECDQKHLMSSTKTLSFRKPQ